MGQIYINIYLHLSVFVCVYIDILVLSVLSGGVGRGGEGGGLVWGPLATHDKQKRGAVGSRCSIVLGVKSREELLWAQTMT